MVYTFLENREFDFISIVQFFMSANSRIRFGLHIAFVCLYTTPPHYHHCANFIWRHWTNKMPIRYNLSGVWVRFTIFSQWSIIQYVGLCVFSVPISLVMIERIYMYTLSYYHHQIGMVCAVCLSIFLSMIILVCAYFGLDVMRSRLVNCCFSGPRFHHVPILINIMIQYYGLQRPYVRILKFRLGRMWAKTRRDDFPTFHHLFDFNLFALTDEYFLNRFLMVFEDIVYSPTYSQRHKIQINICAECQDMLPGQGWFVRNLGWGR